MKQRASFTIEAVIWISLILYMMIGVLQEGIDCYQGHANRSQLQELKEWDSVSTFYELWVLKELGEENADE